MAYFALDPFIQNALRFKVHRQLQNIIADQFSNYACIALHVRNIELTDVYASHTVHIHAFHPVPGPKR